MRSKLWPTRRLFEWRHGQLTQELAAVRESIEGLKTMHSSIDGLRGELTTLRDVVEGLAVRQESIFATQAELRTRLRRTQALSARTYELLHDWPALLTAARSEETYTLAYEEAVPLVSIPIPTFNSPDTLCDRALASVRAQTHSNWEAIVVGDHCTDDTEARVQALGEPRITFYNLPVREKDPDDPWERWALRGSVPRSTGIDLSGGRWIAPLSHDDAWDADHLERLLSAGERVTPRSCIRGCGWSTASVQVRRRCARSALGLRHSGSTGGNLQCSTAGCGSCDTTGRAPLRRSPTTGTWPVGRGKPECAFSSSTARPRRSLSTRGL